MSIKATPSFSLKDQLFNTTTVRQLSQGLAEAYPKFQSKKFEKAVLAKFAKLELKERIHWMVLKLEAFLPADFPQAIKILHESLPTPLDPTLKDDDYGHFIWVVPGEYVAKHGCTKEHLSQSLAFLGEATKRFSSEGAIRPFLNQFPKETMVFILNCAKDSNYHVRRLASEGIRPFLPWAERTNIAAPEVIKVLTRLHADETRYVTRSVANTLNDISKIDAMLVISTLQGWRDRKTQATAELEWMTRHALRTLLKQDHPQALEMFGYSIAPKFKMTDIESSGKVMVGDSFLWRCRVKSLVPQRLKITLCVHYLKANGGHSRKVFAVKDSKFSKDQEMVITKNLPFKPITTRVMYPGTHYAELLVNGVSRGKRLFELRVKE